MSAAAKIEHTYRYPFASFLGSAADPAGPGLRLATCDGEQQSP